MLHHSIFVFKIWPLKDDFQSELHRLLRVVYCFCVINILSKHSEKLTYFALLRLDTINGWVLGLRS